MIRVRLNIVVSVSHQTYYDGVSGPVIVETKREKNNANESILHF